MLSRPISSLSRSAQSLSKRSLSSLSYATSTHASSTLSSYVDRHVAPDQDAVSRMLQTVGYPHMDALLEDTIPAHIRLQSEEIEEMRRVIGDGAEENEALRELRAVMEQNQVHQSYLGMGYYDTLTPTPILRNMLENPSWYTPYTVELVFFLFSCFRQHPVVAVCSRSRTRRKYRRADWKCCSTSRRWCATWWARTSRTRRCWTRRRRAQRR